MKETKGYQTQQDCITHPYNQHDYLAEFLEKIRLKKSLFPFRKAFFETHLNTSSCKSFCRALVEFAETKVTVFTK